MVHRDGSTFTEVTIMDFPVRAFCLHGSNGKIELTITETLGFPADTSYEGGYDVKGSLDIDIGCYVVRFDDYCFSTGVLRGFMEELEKCYETLRGKAVYKRLWENDFAFTLEMTDSGHAVVNGTFQEDPVMNNKLTFELQTDQTYVKPVISDLRKIIRLFDALSGSES